MSMQAPFPYFGGKSKVAPLVWAALGGVRHYMEPFFGSGAVLLARPDYQPGTHVETVCDKDGFLANVWRAMQGNPDEVAKWCDWPVNHADLSARKLKLIAEESRLLENLIRDDEWYDPKMAGYWIWAASCWIGSGLTHAELSQRPHVSNCGQGVHKLSKIPHVGNCGRGVHKLSQIPHVSNVGQGVHKLSQIPHVADVGKGVQEPYNPNIYSWFRQLSERIRYVRVVCGDWTRVCGGNWQDKMGICGMFFDPPYGISDRDTAIYRHDSTTVAKDVTQWCLARGDNPRYRIVLAGYEEHEELLGHGWTAVPWKAQGGYANQGNSQGKRNKVREVLYMSPHCISWKNGALFSEDGNKEE